MSADPLPPRIRTLFAVRLSLLVAALGANLLLLANLLSLERSLILFASATSLYAVITAVWWRCPSCGKYPGNAVMPDFCEACGSHLFGHDREPAPSPTSEHGTPSRRVAVLLVMRVVYGIALVAVFGIWGPGMEHHPLLFWGATIAFMSVGVWAEWRWWRCPHCGGYLKRSLWPGRACPKCGGRLL